MKQIQKEELYENLSQFLKEKGVELKESPYTKGIHAGCSMLADAINLSQAGLERARAGLERGMDQVRQVIHEKTAPKPPEQPQAASAPHSKGKAKTRPRATPGTAGGKGAAKRSHRPRK